MPALSLTSCGHTIYTTNRDRSLQSQERAIFPHHVKEKEPHHLYPDEQQPWDPICTCISQPQRSQGFEKHRKPAKGRKGASSRVSDSETTPTPLLNHVVHGDFYFWYNKLNRLDFQKADFKAPHKHYCACIYICIYLSISISLFKKALSAQEVATMILNIFLPYFLHINTHKTHISFTMTFYPMP